MIVNSYDYVLQNSGTLEDYLYAIYSFANASTFWEVESVTPASPTNANITELRIRLISNNNIKLRFTPETGIFTRDTIKIYFADGVADYGDISGENWSPPCFIDGYIANTTNANYRAFFNATIGAQDTTGNKGCTFVETEDMCAMFVYGKSTYVDNWQFGFMAGKLVDWHIDGCGDWQIMSGSPCALEIEGTTTLNFVSTMPQTLTNAVGSGDNNVSKCCFANYRGEWYGLSTAIWTSAVETFKKLGDPAGTQYEPLVPQVMALHVAKGTSTIGLVPVGYTRYSRFVSSDQALDWFYDSPFSSTISWRRQTMLEPGPTFVKHENLVWIWPQGSPTSIAGTALT